MTILDWIFATLLFTVYIVCLFTVCLLTFRKGYVALGIIDICFPLAHRGDLTGQTGVPV